MILYTDPISGEPVLRLRQVLRTRKDLSPRGNYYFGYGLSVYANLSAVSAKYQTGPNYPNGGEWVANTPTNTEGVSLLWQRKNWDIGLTYKRVGTYYNDNSTLNYKIDGASIPYPVDMAVKIAPWDLVNVFANYTIKNTSRLRGSKIQFAVNNLADSHNITGINPSVKPTAAVLHAGQVCWTS